MASNKITEVERAWLAGLIDGEGCFTLSISYSEKYGMKVSPWFCIGMNDDGTWIHQVSDILNKMGITHYVKSKKNTHVREIVVSGSSNVRAVCDCILPYSRVKRDLVERMIHYRGMSGRNQYSVDTDERKKEVYEVAEFIDFIRAFNRKRNVPHKWNGDTFKRQMGY